MIMAYILIALCIIIIIVHILDVVFLYKNTKSYNNYIIEQEKPKHYLNEYNILKDGKDLIKILDDRIDEVEAMYILLNFEHMDNVYISESLQSEMNKDIFIKVIDSLPKSYLDTLKLLYDHPEDEIRDKVSLAVMDYTIHKNGNYKE